MTTNQRAMENTETVAPSLLSTSADTIRNLHFPSPSHAHANAHIHANAHGHSATHSRATSPSRQSSPFSYFSHPSSPHSSWPSPSSPSGESVSSLPSVGSSFMFSSLPASPPHHQDHQPHTHAHRNHHHHFGEGDNSLIIPSLTLPSALRTPTAYGQTLGPVRLLVLGHSSIASSKLTEEVLSMLADENYEEIVHVDAWEDVELEVNDKGVVAQMLRVSTDWIERQQVHGEKRYEPSRNVEIVKIGDYGPNNSDAMLQIALSLIHASFRANSGVHHTLSSLPLLTARNEEHGPVQTSVAGPSTDLSSPLTLPLIRKLFPATVSPSERGAPSSQSLFTAVLFIPGIPSSDADHQLMHEIGKHVPMIVLPPPLLDPPRSSTSSQHDSTVVDEEDTPRPPSGLPPQLGQPDLVASFETSESFSLLSDTISNCIEMTRERPPPQSSIKPATPIALRMSLYRSPHTIATLRREAVELFLKSTTVDLPSGSAAPETDELDVEKAGADDSRALSAEKTKRWMHQTREDSELSVDDMEISEEQRLYGTLRARGLSNATRRPLHMRSTTTTTRGTVRAATRGRVRGDRRKSMSASIHARPSLLTQSIGSVPPPTSTSPSPSTVGPSSAAGVQSPTQSRRSRLSTQQASYSASAYAHTSTFDPLHIPSLVRLAVEGLLLGPLRVRLARIFSGRQRAGAEKATSTSMSGVVCDDAHSQRSEARQPVKEHRSLIPMALVAGAFCAGVGVGILLARSHANL